MRRFDFLNISSFTIKFFYKIQKIYYKEDIEPNNNNPAKKYQAGWYAIKRLKLDTWQCWN